MYNSGGTVQPFWLYHDNLTVHHTGLLHNNNEQDINCTTMQRFFIIIVSKLWQVHNNYANAYVAGVQTGATCIPNTSHDEMIFK